MQTLSPWGIEVQKKKGEVAANVGSDPTPTGSKPVVLPLHQFAICGGCNPGIPEEN